MRHRIANRITLRLAAVAVPALVAVLLLGGACNSNPLPSDGAGNPLGKLVFTMTDTTIGPPGTYTMNVDGTALTHIAGDGDTVDYAGSWGNKFILSNIGHFQLLSYPQWSPDGQKILCEFQWLIDAGNAIMIMNSDGSDKHVLDKVRSGGFRPQWSPEGDKILFRRSPIGTGIVDADGENDHDFIIAGVPPRIFEGDTVWFHGDYQWGPTDDEIYAIASVNIKPVTYALLDDEIYSLHTQTGLVLERLTRNDVDESSFRLSPDGRYAAFTSGKYGSPSTFHVIALGTGEIMDIPVDNTVSRIWNWANDSRTIVFSKDMNPDPDRNGDRSLYMVDIDRPDELIKLTSFFANHPDLFIPAK